MLAWLRSTYSEAAPQRNSGNSDARNVLLLSYPRERLSDLGFALDDSVFSCGRASIGKPQLCRRWKRLRTVLANSNVKGQFGREGLISLASFRLVPGRSLNRSYLIRTRESVRGAYRSDVLTHQVILLLFQIS
jgi:hypothetical protein